MLFNSCMKAAISSPEEEEIEAARLEKIIKSDNLHRLMNDDNISIKSGVSVDWDRCKRGNHGSGIFDELKVLMSSLRCAPNTPKEDVLKLHSVKNTASV